MAVCAQPYNCVADKLQTENERLRAALKQSLRQWSMYADMIDRDSGFVLSAEESPEADLYRAAYALAHEQGGLAK